MADATEPGPPTAGTILFPHTTRLKVTREVEGEVVEFYLTIEHETPVSTEEELRALISPELLATLTDYKVVAND